MMTGSRLTLCISLLQLAASFGLGSVSAHADAGPCEAYGLALGRMISPEKIPAEVRAHYRQTEFKPNDPMGDYALAALAKNTPRVIAMSMRDHAAFIASRDQLAAALECGLAYFSISPSKDESNDPLLQQLRFLPTQRDFNLLEKAKITKSAAGVLMDELFKGDLSIEGSKNPISVKGMSQMLVRVLQEESAQGLEITQGEEHQWSPEFLAAHKKEFRPYTSMSKPLVALARGETAKFMVTGREDELSAWITGQPDGSVTHPEIFRAALRFNAGNVYLSILTIENLLARNWQNSEREKLPFVQKLSRFTNYLGSNEDRFGHWYHFWGILLYGYLKGSISAKLIGTLESAGSQVMGHFARERQETAINTRGGHVGGRFAKALRGDWKAIPTSPDDLCEEHYLRLDEDYTRRLRRTLKKAEKKARKDAISGA